MQTLGLTKEQMAGMVMRRPVLFAYRVEKSLAPAVDWLSTYMKMDRETVRRRFDGDNFWRMARWGQDMVHSAQRAAWEPVLKQCATMLLIFSSGQALFERGGGGGFKGPLKGLDLFLSLLFVL